MFGCFAFRVDWFVFLLIWAVFDHSPLPWSLNVKSGLKIEEVIRKGSVETATQRKK